MGQIYKIQEETLTGIADSIRKITGKAEPIKVEDISLEIETELSSPKLPTLENEGTASDLISGKELIDNDGNIVTGTFTLADEIDTQDALISQIQTALENKTAVKGEDVDAETEAYSAKLEELETAITALETELEGKASGGTTIEAWTGIVYGSSGLGDLPDIVVYYIDETLSLRKVAVPAHEEATITIAAHTLIGVTHEINPEVPSYGGTNIDGIAGFTDVLLPTADGFTIS